MPAKSRHESSHTQTEIAVLQVHVETIQLSISELKSEIKEVHHSIDRHLTQMQKSLEIIQSNAAQEHEKLSQKILIKLICK